MSTDHRYTFSMLPSSIIILLHLQYENTMVSNDRKVIDASVNPWLWLLSCPVMHFGMCPYKTVLILEKDEVTKTEKSVCGWSESQRTYAELGAVEKSWCCCFVCIDSSIGTIIPGWGCNSEVADAIAEELNSRVSARGGATQLERSEETLQRIQAMASKLDIIMVHLANAPQPVSMDDRTDESHHVDNNLENDHAANTVDAFRGIEYARLELQTLSRLETI